jgi:hypothetical protein
MAAKMPGLCSSSAADCMDVSYPVNDRGLAFTDHADVREALEPGLIGCASLLSLALVAPMDFSLNHYLSHTLP